MEQIALHTSLKSDSIDAYERVHAVIPIELDGALRRAGVTSWKIWRHGTDLFHLVDVEDFQRMTESLSSEPADIAWQERITALLDSRGASEHPLPLVWQLPPG